MFFAKCNRQYMEELIEYIERSPKPGRAFKWKQPSILSFLPSPLKDAVSPNSWRKIYTKQHLQDSMSTIHPVAFNVKQVELNSLNHYTGRIRIFLKFREHGLVLETLNRQNEEVDLQIGKRTPETI